MTFEQFKSWFDGYCAAAGNALTSENIAQIKTQLSNVVFFNLEPSANPVRDDLDKFRIPREPIIYRDQGDDPYRVRYVVADMNA